MPRGGAEPRSSFAGQLRALVLAAEAGQSREREPRR